MGGGKERERERGRGEEEEEKGRTLFHGLVCVCKALPPLADSKSYGIIDCCVAAPPPPTADAIILQFQII